jgi:hypothetical protein
VRQLFGRWWVAGLIADTLWEDGTVDDKATQLCLSAKGGLVPRTTPGARDGEHLKLIHEKAEGGVTRIAFLHAIKYEISSDCLRVSCKNKRWSFPQHRAYGFVQQWVTNPPLVQQQLLVDRRQRSR